MINLDQYGPIWTHLDPSGSIRTHMFQIGPQNGLPNRSVTRVRVSVHSNGPDVCDAEMVEWVRE